VTPFYPVSLIHPIISQDDIYAFFIGSEATMRKVAIGPRNNDKSHQFMPLLPFACARPALMRESVNHPTAY
jgi:hypothetical protein